MNDRVLKGHTKTANILFYVSGALQTRIWSRGPIDDTTSYPTPVNDKDGTGEGGGEDEDTSSSSSSSEGVCIGSRGPIADLQDDTTSYPTPVNDEDGTGEGGGEDDDAS
jgi:hypothetical protein